MPSFEDMTLLEREHVVSMATEEKEALIKIINMEHEGNYGCLSDYLSSLPTKQLTVMGKTLIYLSKSINQIVT